MLKRVRKHAHVFIVLVLCSMALFLFERADVSASKDVLTVSFLDVGQGDSIFIETPSGRQMLIDGGMGLAVLQELGMLLPFSDRRIDLVLVTHPDLDHIGSLPDVFKRYEVGAFMEPGVQDPGPDYAALQEAVRDEGLTPIAARTGQRLALDEDVYVDVLFPDRDVRGVEANMGSVVLRLVHGDVSFLLTGDSPEAIEEYMVGVHGTALKSTVLKLGHHGSRTSSGALFLSTVRPEYAVVSAGCDNRYGHPHTEVVERVRAAGAIVLGTCEEGTIVFESDGAKVAYE